MSVSALELNQMLLCSIPWTHPRGSGFLCSLGVALLDSGAPEVYPSRSELGAMAGHWVAAWPGLHLAGRSWKERISPIPDSSS